MAVSGLILAAALLASDPDGVVVTAPATTVDLEANVQPVAASTGGATQEAVPHGLTLASFAARVILPVEFLAWPYPD
jgi:hypothetical protein